jgi:hypothetical protein
MKEFFINIRNNAQEAQSALDKEYDFLVNNKTVICKSHSKFCEKKAVLLSRSGSIRKILLACLQEIAEFELEESRSVEYVVMV